MALHFLTSTSQTFDVYITCDPSVKASDENKRKYLKSRDASLLEVDENATVVTLKALGPAEREAAEIRAGAFTRDELGKFLYYEYISISDAYERAEYHHKLDESERIALAKYEQYTNNVALETIREGLVSLNGEPVNLDMIQAIRPNAVRIQTITEIFNHIITASNIGDVGK